MAENETAMKEIRKRLIECLDAYNSGDVEKSASYYAPDAQLLPPGFDAATGSEAILQGLQYSYNVDGVKRLDYEIVEVQVAGPDVGFTCSRSTARDADGNPKGNFKDLMLWKKTDGKWLCFREMFNARP